MPRKKANKASSSNIESHKNTGANDSENRLPNENGPSLRRLTVLFCERELQQTLDIDASTTISEAKKIGSRHLLDYLRGQPNAPPGLSIDDECTDFFPGKVM
jgi:hypothetical protein